jgi:hypothetical protein
LVIHLEAVANRLERQHNERALQAWQTAALYRVKRLPSLNKLFLDRKKKKEPIKKQSWERQLQIAMQWHKMFSKRK